MSGDSMTTLGAAAASVVANLRRPWPLPPFVEQYDATSRETWLKLRKRDATASAIGCLIAPHDFMTPYQYWADRSGFDVARSVNTEAVERGNDLEPVVIKRVQRAFPKWEIWNPGVYLRDASARVGATPDAWVICPERGRGIVQIKTTVDSVFRDKWKADGEVAPPTWIAIQALLEAHLSGAEWACVAVMVLSGYGSGLDVHVIDVPRSEALIRKIYAAAADFWARVESGTPPDADYGRDADVIRAIYAADDGSEVDLTGNNRIIELIDHRDALRDTITAGAAADKQRKTIDTEIIDLMGAAARARLADGRIIEAKTVNRGAYQVAATSYRTVKIKGANL